MSAEKSDGGSGCVSAKEIKKGCIHRTKSGTIFDFRGRDRDYFGEIDLIEQQKVLRFATQTLLSFIKVRDPPFFLKLAMVCYFKAM